MTLAGVNFNMKTTDPRGMSMDEFEARIDREAAAAKDYVAPCEKLKVEYDDGQYRLEVKGVGNFGMTQMFHKQLATRANTPLKFYDRAKSYPDEFVPLLNKLIQEEWGGDALVRTMDGNARALLSDSYSIFDNLQLVKAVIPAVRELGDFQVKSASVSEIKMFLKLVFPNTRTEVAVGDVVEAGIMISNSEVGAGAAAVSKFMNRLICMNGAVINDAKFSKRHLGRALMGDGAEARQLFQSDTIAASHRAMHLQIRDMVIDVGNPKSFEVVVQNIREAASGEKLVNPERTVRMLASTYDLTEEENGHVMRHLIEGADITRWGMVNAVTAAAKDVTTYDRATELETFGGSLLGLSSKEWSNFATA